MMSVGAFSRSGLKISHTVLCSNRTSLICCAAAGKKTRVTFNLPKKVPFGDKVSIVGSTPELGSWDADAAPELHWSNADVWTTNLDLPSGAELEYKFVVQQKGGQKAWQQGDNLSIQVPEDSNTTLLVSDGWDGRHEVRAGPGRHPQATGPAAADLAATPAQSSSKKEGAPSGDAGSEQLQAPAAGDRVGAELANAGNGSDRESAGAQAVASSTTTASASPKPRARATSRRKKAATPADEADTPGASATTTRGVSRRKKAAAAPAELSDTPKPRARATSRRKKAAAPADGADAVKPRARGESRRKKAAAQEDKSGEALAGSGAAAAQEYTEEELLGPNNDTPALHGSAWDNMLSAKRELEKFAATLPEGDTLPQPTSADSSEPISQVPGIVYKNPAGGLEDMYVEPEGAAAAAGEQDGSSSSEQQAAPHAKPGSSAGQEAEKDDLSKLTVAQLKECLRERGLPVSGVKAELLERLTDNMTVPQLKEELRERNMLVTGRKSELKQRLTGNEQPES